MSGSHLFTPHNDDVDEMVASMINELIYWRSHGNNSNTIKRILIYKVLQCIRASDPNAYEPRVLSIGPYHHGAPSLLPLEKEKWISLDYVLKLNSKRSLHDYLVVTTALERDARICYSDDNLMSRRMFVEMLLLDSCFILVCLNGIGGVPVQRDIHERCSKDQDVLIEVVAAQNNEARVHKKGKQTMAANITCLSHRINDGFALQIEQQDHFDSHQDSRRGNNMDSYNVQTHENIEHGEQWYNSSAVYDLLLLENQIPFFVVTEIYDLLVNGERSHGLLNENMSKFIEGILLHFPLAIQDNNNSPKDFDHLLHLCYLYFKPSRSIGHQQMKKRSYFQALLFWAYKYFCSIFQLQKTEENRPSCAHFRNMHSCKKFQRWRRAEQYHEAGVEFKDRVFDERNPHSLLDIEFRDGILHIPCLPIDDKSGTLFRNLVAFEQSCPELGNDMASYLYFLSQLISVPDDVALLSRKGVIVHQLDTDDEVSTLFARLFEYVIFDFYGEHYLKSLCNTLEAHYQSRVNRWMAWLWHKHFGNPWLGFAALASIVMVFCSLGQTILAILSYMSMS
ncbi:unnamed protein product [Urochloa humidicola]